MNRKYDSELLFKLLEDGYSIKQMSEIAGYTLKQVRTWLNSRALICNRYDMLDVDETLIQFIYGSILGDGHLEKISGHRKQSRLTFGHSTKQKDYVEYKDNFLKGYNLSIGIGVYTTYSHWFEGGERQGKYTTMNLKSIAHPLFTKYRELFYDNNIKYVNTDIGNIEPFGLAIWYMDDGGICTRSYQINSQGFTVYDVELLRSVLDSKFNIKTTQDKNNVIYVRTESKQLFTDIIYPYIVDSMKYKIRKDVRF